MNENLLGLKRVVICLGVWAALLIGTAARLSAQVVGATLSGTITDASGSVIPKVQVSIGNSGTDIVRTVLTDANDFTRHRAYCGGTTL
jgi:hydrogenase/urease accessory protein HupE